LQAVHGSGSGLTKKGGRDVLSKSHSMDLAEFRATLAAAAPPAGLRPLLRALWLDAKGAFDQAHEIAQNTGDADGARLHAYLHRKEGDLSNARYWYRRAGAAEESGTLDAEWEALVQRFL
jgi:hypothetical protein